MAPKRSTPKPRRAVQWWVFLLLLAAFGVRATWLPGHLAREPHGAIGPLVLGSTHAAHRHDHPHRHGEHQGRQEGAEHPREDADGSRHDSHSATDHELTLFPRRPAPELLAGLALPLEETIVLRPRSTPWRVAEPLAPAPREWPPGIETRGPPRC